MNAVNKTKLHPAPGMHGSVLEERRDEGLHLSKTAYDPSANLGYHEHALAYISLVLCGRYAEVTRDGPVDCRPGTVIVHAPGERHADLFQSDPAVVLNIEFDEEWSAADGRVLGYPFSLERLTAGLRTMAGAWEADGLPEPAEIRDCLSLLVDAPEPLEEAPPRWLRAVRAELHESPANAERSIRALAHDAGVHHVHLSRAFHAHFGITPTAFRTRRRIALAAAELAHSEEGMSGLAQRHGFADQSHFSRVFKRSTGLTPADYRRRLRLANNACRSRSN